VTATSAVRVVHVDADRLVRWVDGFGARHGGAAGPPRAAGPGALEVVAADGCTATLRALFDDSPEGSFDVGQQAGGGQEVPALAARAGHDRRVVALLVRRGGYACAVLDGPSVTASKVGSRRVQGRTAAGGWSQQRFARRREGQARELAGAAADVAARLLVPAVSGPPGTAAGPPWQLVTGGDRALIAQVLTDPRLAALAVLPRGPHLPVPDPRAQTVRELPAQLRGVEVTLRPSGSCAEARTEG
jgi:hypothetical protein